MASRRVNGPLLVVVLVILSWGQPDRAVGQFAVEDVYVGMQTSITAINSARALVQEGIQIANQVQMIRNQLEMLAYAAANLTKSPLQIVQQLQALIGQYEAILRQAEGVGFALDQVNARFGTLYGLFGEPIADVQRALSQLSTLTKEVRTASRTAMQAQAIQERLAAQRDHLQVALTESEASAGQLAVAQNTNQILGIVVEQNASLQQLYAASARAQTTMTMAEAAASDQARQLAAHSLSTWGQMEEVQGVGIPEFR